MLFVWYIKLMSTIFCITKKYIYSMFVMLLIWWYHMIILWNHRPHSKFIHSCNSWIIFGNVFLILVLFLTVRFFHLFLFLIIFCDFCLYCDFKFYFYKIYIIFVAALICFINTSEQSCQYLEENIRYETHKQHDKHYKHLLKLYKKNYT